MISKIENLSKEIVETYKFEMFKQELFFAMIEENKELVKKLVTEGRILDDVFCILNNYKKLAKGDYSDFQDIHLHYKGLNPAFKFKNFGDDLYNLDRDYMKFFSDNPEYFVSNNQEKTVFNFSYLISAALPTTLLLKDELFCKKIFQFFDFDVLTHTVKDNKVSLVLEVKQ